MESKKYPWTIEKIPFFIANYDKPENPNNLPNEMKFIVDVDRKTGRVCQLATESTERALKEAYRVGSEISGFMSHNGIGRKYAEDFYNFIAHNTHDGFDGKKVLEIGCGTGYLLSLFKKQGASVVGIEPSLKTAVDDYGVKIIREFYPSKHMTERYDLVIAYGVLEHITDIEVFLNSTKNNLNSDGYVFFAVPDCCENISSGDASMFIHEHISYFTAETLYSTLEIFFRGYSIDVVKSKFGGLLYACVTKSGKSLCDETTISVDEEFPNRVVGAIGAIESWIKDKDDIGIYVPARFINYYSILEMGKSGKRIRFFDDNPLIEGKYFPSIPISVENPSVLSERAVQNMLIMSFAFSDDIEKRIGSIASGVSVNTIRGIL